MVNILGGDYPLTIVMPFFLIIAMVVFFIATYIKDNIGKLRIKLGKKKKKAEKIPTNFSKEYSILKKEVRNYSTSESLDALTDIIKRYISEKLNIDSQFSFEELPRNKLDWPIIEFTKRLSDLKYSGREVTRAEVNHLMVYLSKILKIKSYHDAPEKESGINKLIKLPRIELKLPKFLKRRHQGFHPKKHIKPIDIGLPKKITINLSWMFKDKKPVESHRVLEVQQKIISLISLSMQNLDKYHKALKYYKRAFNLNESTPKKDFSSKLKNLYHNIIRFNQKQIKNKHEKKISRIKIKLSEKISELEKNINNYSKSIRLHKKSLGLLDKIHDKDHFKPILNKLYNQIVERRKNKIRLKEESREKSIKKLAEEKDKILKLRKDKRLKKIEDKINSLVSYAEKQIQNNTKKSLKYYKKVVFLSKKYPSLHFKERLDKLHKAILDFEKKKLKLSKEQLKQQTPVPVPEEVHRTKHHKKHKISFFEKIRINLQSKRILKLIKKAEKISFNHPLLSKKLYNEALMMYYKLPIDKEESIAIRLNKFYERAKGNHEKELINIKHYDKKNTKEALKHLKRYKNYVIIENNHIKNNIRKSLNDVRFHSVKYLTKTKYNHIKRDIVSFLKLISREEENIFSLEEKSIKTLLNKAYKILRFISREESNEAYEEFNAIRKIFSHLKVNHKISNVPLPTIRYESIKSEIQKPFLHDIKMVSSESVPETQLKPLYKEPLKIKPPEIKTVKKKIDISPPKLPEKRISERMKKLMDEKQSVYSKLKELEGKELDRFKNARRLTTHEEIGYHDFIKELKPKSQVPEEHKIKKLFEAK